VDTTEGDVNAATGEASDWRLMRKPVETEA
jgi:hypothetical protein